MVLKTPYKAFNSLILFIFFTFVVPSLSLAVEGLCPSLIEQVSKNTLLTEKSPIYNQVAYDFLKQLLQDYQKTLDVYFEFKLRSKTPTLFVNEFSATRLKKIVGDQVFKTLDKRSREAPEWIDSVGEFRVSEYDLFRNKMDADSRLKDNLFLALLNRQGGGGANDVFQRVGGYAFELYAKVDMKNREFSPKELDMMMAITSIALGESRIMFKLASEKWGYPQNTRHIRATKLDQVKKARETVFGPGVRFVK